MSMSEQYETQQPAPGATQPVGTPARPGATLQRGRVPTIHYELSYVAQNAERGPRGAVVLLHDLPGGAFVWQGVLPALAATGRAVYAFDLLGYGASDHPWPADCTVWGHADNLAPALRALDLEDIVLVGFGVGGGAAQVLATRMYREGIGALALLASYAYDYAYAPGWPLPDMEQRHDPDAPRHTTNDQLLADLRATLPAASAKPQYLAGSVLDAYTREWSGDLGREVLYQHVRQMIPNYILSVASDLKKLEVPSLVVWGERDAVTPPTLAQRLARDLPGARLDVIAEAGHLLLDDASDRVGSVLADWINGLR
jgi:pimeloyl-ACP methyl ester carboxylesterase